MPTSPISTRRRSPIVVAIGLALALGAAGLDLVGLGGGSRFGMRELALFAAGVGLVASQLCNDAVRARPSTCVLAWLGLGLATGWAEVAVVALSRAFGKVVHEPDHYVWIIPPVIGAIFLALGCVCALGLLVLRRPVPLPAVLSTPVIVGVWSAARRLGWLSDYAMLLLAIGVTVVFARAVRARPDGIRRLWRIPIAATLLACAVAPPLLWWRASAREQQAIRALAPPPAGAPNVLLIVLDTVRADHLGTYGYARKTSPAIDRLASTGIVFDRALSTAPWTLPSHASMFTGRHAHETSASWHEALDATHPTLAEALCARGYATAGFIGNLYYCGRENGIARGFVHYEDYSLTPGVVLTAASLGYTLAAALTVDPSYLLRRNDAATVIDGFLDWQSRQEPGRPFFAFLNLFDAHYVYRPPAAYADRFGATDGEHMMDMFRRGTRWSRWSASEQQRFVDAYDSCVAYLDDEVGRLLEALRARGVLDHTLVVITADHGEHFGEHDLMEHACSLYLPLLHVPLIVSLPGRVPADRRIDRWVSLVDLPATVLELAGFAEDMPGSSWSATWSEGGDPESVSPVAAELRRRSEPPPWAAPTLDDMHVLVDGDLHYIVGEGGREELYDVRQDPRQEHDLAASRPDAVARLRAALGELVDPR